MRTESSRRPPSPSPVGLAVSFRTPFSEKKKEEGSLELHTSLQRFGDLLTRPPFFSRSSASQHATLTGWGHLLLPPTDATHRQLVIVLTSTPAPPPPNHEEENRAIGGGKGRGRDGGERVTAANVSLNHSTTRLDHTNLAPVHITPLNEQKALQ